MSERRGFNIYKEVDIIKINKIQNIDCCEGIQELINCGVEVDMIMTSPPYFNSNKKYQRGSGIHYGKDMGEIMYVIEDFLELAYEVLRDNRFMCLNLGFSYGETGVLRPYRIVERATKFGWFVVDDIIWHKTNPVPLKNRLENSIEHIFVLTKHPHNDYPNKDEIGYQHNYFEVEGNYEPVIESSVVNQSRSVKGTAQFPLEVPEFCIDIFSKPKELVLDTFAGVGTTGEACMKLDRYFLGFEIQEKLVKIGNDRIEGADKHD